MRTLTVLASPAVILSLAGGAFAQHWMGTGRWADLTGDWIVDHNDLRVLACRQPFWCGYADINADETVDLADFAEMAGSWQRDYMSDF
jgi:hypothetical protein